MTREQAKQTYISSHFNEDGELKEKGQYSIYEGNRALSIIDDIYDYYDKVWESQNEGIKELAQLHLRTCESCKYLVIPIDIPICDKHNYILTNDSKKVLSCNKWESK